MMLESIKNSFPVTISVTAPNLKSVKVYYFARFVYNDGIPDLWTVREALWNRWSCFH